jgi:hypothetical protein
MRAKQKTLLLAFQLILFLPCITDGQSYFAEYMIAGTSLTYIRDSREIYQNYKSSDDEYTWNINVGVAMSKRIFAGLQWLNIYASEVSTPKEYYSVYGLFSQYNFLKNQQHRLFLELSFNRGNFCTRDYQPFRKDNLYYLGSGLGYDLPIKKIRNLYLDLSFISYAILNNNYRGLYNQYIIGLNYRIKER